MRDSLSRQVHTPGVFRAALAAALLLGLGAGVSGAALCGDDLGGQRVACSCGDVVVSDTTLRSSDPVVSARCPLDGLIVRAHPLAETLTLDLGGLSLVGSGVGHGLRVERGGSEGAVIVGDKAGGSGQLVGFGTGVLVVNSAALRRMQGLEVRGSRHEGFSIRASGALLVGLSASDNGGDGMRLQLEGGRLLGSEASNNKGVGIRLKGRGTEVEATVTGNGEHGVLSDGGMIDLGGVVARGNGGHGVVARGGRQKTVGVVSEGNALEDLRMRGRELGQ
ncbi:MAG: right-handed parallel beta-helix repeat-containing protein [Candidatus Binatia bacterium]